MSALLWTLAVPIASALVLSMVRSPVAGGWANLLASALGALCSRLHAWIVLPTVVLEIVIGIIIGPEVLDVAQVNDAIVLLSNFGLSMLFFFAGLEVIEKRVPMRAVRRGTAGWGLSLAIGLAIGLVLQQAGLGIHPVWFNHNDLYHVIQAAALVLVARAGRRLRDAT